MNTSVFVETEKHETFSLPTIVYDIMLLSLLIIIDITCTFAGIWFICMEGGGTISCKKKFPIQWGSPAHIPNRWRMCTISYSIPRWCTAISWAVSTEARKWSTTPKCIDKRSKNWLDWKVHITPKTQANDLCSLLFNIIVFVECPSCPDWK